MKHLSSSLGGRKTRRCPAIDITPPPRLAPAAKPKAPRKKLHYVRIGLTEDQAQALKNYAENKAHLPVSTTAFHIIRRKLVESPEEWDVATWDHTRSLAKHVLASIKAGRDAYTAVGKLGLYFEIKALEAVIRDIRTEKGGLAMVYTGHVNQKPEFIPRLEAHLELRKRQLAGLEA